MLAIATNKKPATREVETIELSCPSDISHATGSVKVKATKTRIKPPMSNALANKGFCR